MKAVSCRNDAPEKASRPFDVDRDGFFLLLSQTKKWNYSIIEQENMGLTRALIRGCEEARGTYIARQDSGDISHPERLKKQINYLEFHRDVSLVSCWTIILLLYGYVASVTPVNILLQPRDYLATFVLYFGMLLA